MAHVFFFSYARENLDNHLRAFFEDLCENVAPFTKWAAEDPNLSFRDGKNLPLMDNWQPSIMDALQASSVLVSVTSPAYFQKRFCGQEYWVFDERRKHIGGAVPEVVLPVIWAPVRGKLPILNAIQWQAAGLSPLYATKGLRYLKIADRNEYEKCVLAFADAIQNAWNQYLYPPIPPLPGVGAFEQIPDAFAGGDWSEAADSRGWLPGPGVANFVFAAARAHELNTPAGRYGASAAEWRPYLPPEPRTVADIAKAAAKKHSLRYREIPVNDQLAHELAGARGRKNLTLVLADPQTLPIADFQPVATFDVQKWEGEGAALLMLCDDAVGPWNTMEPIVSNRFPIASKLKPPAYLAPIRGAGELDELLDVTLADLRNALTQAEAQKKNKTDEAPARISATPGGAA